MAEAPDLSQLDLSQFSTNERVVIEEYMRRQALRAKGNSFLDFVEHVNPWFVVEEVH